VKTFRVALTITVPISTVLEIEANDEKEAMDAVIEKVCVDAEYCIHDFDGNEQDTTADDVEIDSVEEIEQ
jgi:hypothetical protein